MPDDGTFAPVPIIFHQSKKAFGLPKLLLWTWRKTDNNFTLEDEPHGKEISRRIVFWF